MGKKGNSDRSGGIGRNGGKKECDDDFVTHWWCRKHGRFYGDAGDRHGMKGNEE